tara:strand:+ start:7096 stop:7275 length:180 start_codon:yes stop_codon:yes gene_type:complete
MKTYILTIEYNEDTEEVEYLTEEIVEDKQSFYYGSMALNEYFDEETLALLDGINIIGES